MNSRPRELVTTYRLLHGVRAVHSLVEHVLLSVGIRVSLHSTCIHVWLTEVLLLLHVLPHPVVWRRHLVLWVHLLLHATRRYLCS